MSRPPTRQRKAPLLQPTGLRGLLEEVSSRTVVEPTITKFIVSPDEALRLDTRCPLCCVTGDLLTKMMRLHALSIVKQNVC